jgi:hypothetical protein
LLPLTTWRSHLTSTSTRKAFNASRTKHGEIRWSERRRRRRVIRLASSCHKAMVVVLVVVAKDAIASTVGSSIVCVKFYRFRI